MADCPHFRLSSPWLIAVAGIVWAVAGVNVARIGIGALPGVSLHAPWVCVLPIVVFAAFGAMFLKVVGKHVKRIRAFPQPARPFWHFFDARSYLLMAVMMGAGFGLRAFSLLPDGFVAVYYTGLGAALASAGVAFLLASVKTRKG